MDRLWSDLGPIKLSSEMEEALHYMPLTLFTLLTLLSVDTIDTVYTIQIALHCLNSSMYAFKYSLERLERELE